VTTGHDRRHRVAKAAGAVEKDLAGFFDLAHKGYPPTEGYRGARSRPGADRKRRRQRRLHHAVRSHGWSIVPAQVRNPDIRKAAQISELQPHSITSSARARVVDGTVSPNACAVLRLITRSNLVGCSIGRSAGLMPLNILST